MRDPSIWQTSKNGEWSPLDAVWKHPIGQNEEAHRIEQVKDRTFSDANRHLYYNPDKPPQLTGDYRLDQKPLKFKVL